MEYVGRVPAPPLDRLIDDIHYLTGVPRHRRMNVPPMPSAHLFVNLGGPVRLWDSGSSVPSERLAASHGAVPVGTLADAAGVSGNHLAMQFKSHAGVAPKRVARIYRFTRLILSIDALHPVGWPELAQTTGYFDQAHFSREFKEFTGHTPTEYLALRRRFPAEQGFPPDSGPMPTD